MSEFHSNAAQAASEGLDEFTAAYIMAAYFTDTGEDGQPGTEAEIEPDTLERIKADCEKFQNESCYLDFAIELTGNDYADAGRDFWFTRNGHGSGFWDGDWGELGEDLSKEARRFGECAVFETDAGRIAMM